MLNRSLLITALMVAASAASASSPTLLLMLPQTRVTAPEVVSGELLVKVSPGSDTAARRAYSSLGATVIGSIPSSAGRRSG